MVVSKKIWSNINCILGKKHSSINNTIKLDGKHVAEPETNANAFNSYFNSIPITLSDNINNNLTAFGSCLDDEIPESDNFHQTSTHEITKIIKNLKNSKSVGWDNNPANILKINVMTLAPILSNLINKSLAQGLFSQSLKRAKILPIFKSKDKLNIANYRPIFILPVISKVYEKVFYSRLHDNFSTNNILSSSQFGFRSGGSTKHALLKFTDHILKCFDDNKVGIATFMDLSKAFE